MNKLEIFKADDDYGVGVKFNTPTITREEIVQYCLMIIGSFIQNVPENMQNQEENYIFDCIARFRKNQQKLDTSS